MKNVIKMSLVAAVVAGMSSVSAQAADGISIFDNVKVKGEIRPRYEMVDADKQLGGATPGTVAKKGNANAMTNRLVLGVGADLFGTDWLSTYVEMTDVHALNKQNFNSSNNGVTDKNIVADPEQTRLTQAYLDFKFAGAKLRTGRQMINLDNQRFIGAVGWRQMPQTFDAHTLTYNGVENLNLFASYVYQTNRIFADEASSAKTGKFDSESLLLNAKYKVMDALTVTAYGYLLSNRAESASASSVTADNADTYGIALTGKPKLGDITLNYRAEYAMMTDGSFDAGNTPSLDEEHDADYMNLELGMNMSGILAGIGYEVQSGMTNAELADPNQKNKTFSTPLGTNHKFNGWADVFLSTPDNGLEDLNLMVGYKSKQVGVIKAVYHKFDSAEESISYGTEFDLLYKRAIPGVKGLTGMLKYANYSADDSYAQGNPAGQSEDVSKFWAMLDYKFSN